MFLFWVDPSAEECVWRRSGHLKQNTFNQSIFYMFIIIKNATSNDGFLAIAGLKFVCKFNCTYMLCGVSWFAVFVFWLQRARAQSRLLMSTDKDYWTLKIKQNWRWMMLLLIRGSDGNFLQYSSARLWSLRQLCVCLWRMLFLLSRSIECIVDDDDYDDKDDSKLSLNSIN